MVVLYIVLSITAVATAVLSKELGNIVLATNTNIHSIPVGKGPDALFLTPDEKILYVANVEDTFISVIDTKQDKVIKKIEVTHYPWGFTRLGSKNLVAVSSWDKGIALAPGERCAERRRRLHVPHRHEHVRGGGQRGRGGRAGSAPGRGRRPGGVGSHPHISGSATAHAERDQGHPRVHRRPDAG